VYGKLTCSSLFYLLCRDTQDIQYFHHYLNNDVCHSLAWFDLRISLQTFEKVLDPLKDVDQGLLRCIDILNCLASFVVKLGLRRDVCKILTWRRTPAPANITVAGEKTYVVTLTFIPKQDHLILTRLTPPPMVAENVRRTLTVGPSHFVNLSSLFRA
jgi:hypothetical protein